MDNEILIKLISASVSPAVMISGTGLLIMGFLNRQGMLTGRLRELHDSALRHAELAQEKKSAYYADRATLSMQQAKAVFSRASNVKWTLIYLFSAVIMFVVTSVFLGLGVIWAQAIALATLAFVMGVFAIFVAMCFALGGVLRSLSPLKHEEAQTDRLLKEIAGITSASTDENPSK